jgi:5-methylcytosine-specific restriction endonuclease McrA
MENVLVLNYDYSPLSITSWTRGFTLVYTGKAEIIKTDDNPIISVYKNYVRPLIIRLLNYIRYHRKSLKVTRNRIFKRDNHQCVYCGSKKDLTLDHVIPKSRGGKNEWSNLVSSCSKCNLKKADRTPEEAKMNMVHNPYELTIVDEHKSIHQVWNEYKKSFSSIDNILDL